MHARAGRWLVAAGVALAVSAAAVALAVMPGSGPVVSAVAQAAETFASPGEFLWWTTLGGVFAGRPNDATGYAVWVLGTALFWFVACAPFVALAGRRRRSRKESP